MEFVKNHEKTALIYDDKSVSYEELIKNSHYFGSQLQIKKEEKVLIFSPNRPELIYSFLGIWEHNGTVIIADYTSSVEELVYILKDSEVKYIYTTLEAKSKIEKALEQMPYKINVLYFENNNNNNYNTENTAISAPAKECISLILYTSGTTGDPKGVMLSFGNIHAMAIALGEYNVFEKDDIFLALLPLHHIFPLLGSAIIPIYFGSTIVFLKELASDKILEAFKKYQITILIGVPRLYEVFHRNIMNKIEASKIARLIFAMAKHINSQGFKKKIFKKVQDEFGSHVKFFISGGAKLDPEIGSDLGTLGFSVIEGYGLTETSPIISFTRPNQIKYGSCGHIIPMAQVKFTEDGELLIKGENVFQGYYNKPEKTAEAFTEDGYFKTGDIGNVDSEGFLTITGRTKEMIVLSNGKNINPLDIERELLKISNGIIEEIAILEHENILKAIIFPNFKLIAEKKIQNIHETIKWTVIDIYNSQAPKYKKILNIKLVKEELPKTKLGKLRRFKLKDIINDEDNKRKNIDEPDFEEYLILKKYLNEAINKTIYPDNHIELDLGFDSLEMVELNAFISKRFGLQVDEAAFANNPTVEKLSLFIKENRSTTNNTSISENNFDDDIADIKLPSASWLLNVGKAFGKFIFNTYFRIKVDGKIKIEGPFIMVGNHQSFLDAFILDTIIPTKLLKNTYFMATSVHFEKPFKKFVANNSNTIIVNINQNLGKTLKETAYALKKGKNMVIFPEGARTRDGEINEFKKSFAILSKELGIPVVPFGIEGAYEAMPYGSIIPRPAKIKIKIFDPIYPDNYNPEEIVENTRITIKNWLNSIERND